MIPLFRRSSVALLVVLLAVVVFQTSPSAHHSWGGYHWARTTSSFSLAVGNNLSSQWSGYLSQASSDWSLSSVLDTSVVSGGGGKPRTCRATAGRVEVCNSAYGNTGWLGVAQIWISGVHITQGTVKVNDTYFNTTYYNTPGWRQMVICQEVGHTFGLDHQDEAFNNSSLGTCMDYTNNPIGPPDNAHPNAHDYDELVTIYSHLDGFTTVKSTISSGAHDGLEHHSEWGNLKKVSHGGKTQIFERDLGKGERVVTFVIWA